MNPPRLCIVVWSRALGIVACGALLLATSCGGGDGGSKTPDVTEGPAVHAVTVNDGNFFPKEITIALGDSVVWTWAVNNDHSITSGTTPDPSEDPRMFDSGVRSSGSFGYRFTVTGSYSYFCRKHGDMGMTGRVTIQQP